MKHRDPSNCGELDEAVVKVTASRLTFSAHPLISLSGSLQIRSQSIPVSGMSVGRTILAIWSTLVNSGFRGTLLKTMRVDQITRRYPRRNSTTYGEPAVHTEDLFINNCGCRKAVKYIRERFPKLNTVTALAFVIEAIDSVDARTLMISSARYT